MSDHYLKLYVGDYLADTGHLSTVEHGAYLLLLMHSWRTGPLPDDDARLAAIARMSRPEWRRVADVIRAFFTSTDAGLIQRRLERERNERTNKQAQQSAAGKASAAQRTLQRNANERSTDVATNEPTKGQPPLPELDQEERKVPPSAAAVPAAVEPPIVDLQLDAEPIDARTRLFRDGLAHYRALTGKAEGPSRTRLGQLLRLAKDDAARVFEALAEARDLRPADPDAWLSRALTPASGKPANWALEACFGGRA